MRPAHYSAEYEPLELIRLYNLNFELGNVVKYLARCNFKGEKVNDLAKAVDYLRRAGECKLPKKHKYEFVEHHTRVVNFARAWGLSINLYQALNYVCNLENLPRAEFYILKELNEGDKAAGMDDKMESPFED
jgi:hypothetical protein